MELQLSQAIGLPLNLVLSYETAGDLELLSLHRIRNRINSLTIDGQVKQVLVAELVKENQEYIESSGRNWRCITPRSLDTAVDNTRNYLTERTNLAVASIDDLAARSKIRSALEAAVSAQDKKIRTWFANNYDHLIYNTDGEIPFPIVRMMRDAFAVWALGKANPFHEPIEDVISRAATASGINPDDYDSYETVWEQLKEFKK